MKLRTSACLLFAFSSSVWMGACGGATTVANERNDAGAGDEAGGSSGASGGQK